MHYLMLVTLTYLDGDTSLNARRQAEEILLQDESFCGTGGRFGSPPCDWFVIGGRWSGFLKTTLLGDDYQQAFRNEFPEPCVEQREPLNRLWQRFGGTGEHPFNRNYRDEATGCDDDAMLVDQDVYDQFLAEHEGNLSARDDQGDWTFADLDDEPVDTGFIGRKWLVVVDYHN